MPDIWGGQSIMFRSPKMACECGDCSLCCKQCFSCNWDGCGNVKFYADPAVFASNSACPVAPLACGKKVVYVMEDVQAVLQAISLARILNGQPPVEGIHVNVPQKAAAY
jgi:hypothetical protein